MRLTFCFKEMLTTSCQRICLVFDHNDKVLHCSSATRSRVFRALYCMAPTVCTHNFFANPLWILNAFIEDHMCTAIGRDWHPQLSDLDARLREPALSDRNACTLERSNTVTSAAGCNACQILDHAAWLAQPNSPSSLVCV